jgi:hypothetical protein
MFAYGNDLFYALIKTGTLQKQSEHFIFLAVFFFLYVATGGAA